MTELKRCPCGKIPEKLYIEEGSTMTYAKATGDCCDRWGVELRTVRHDVFSKRTHEAAIKAWNDAPRGEENIGDIKAEAIQEAIIYAQKCIEEKSYTGSAMIETDYLREYAEKLRGE